jgi:V8-like Glu-specific endopeptidase
MFADLKEIKSEKDGKIIIYHEIQTSEGQSGAPIILKLQDLYQIIGVHTC